MMGWPRELTVLDINGELRISSFLREKNTRLWTYRLV
jgi:hypothetical protein